jgi:ankyrin repeat protein
MSNQHISNPNAYNKANEPIMFDAIANMDLAEVKRLVEAGADIELQGFGEQTAALMAASARQWDICLYLLEQGADPTVADDVGLTIPRIAFNARIYPDSYQGPYFAKVKEFLIKRNLERLNMPGKQVLELKAAGNWPPK